MVQFLDQMSILILIQEVSLYEGQGADEGVLILGYFCNAYLT